MTNFVTSSASAPPSAPMYDLGVPVPYVAPPVTGLGGRDATVAPSIDAQFLAQACDTPTVLKNNHSPGASGLLKEFLYETGYPYQVHREIFNDSAGHQAGNAVDVSSADLGSLCRFLAKIPQLFDKVAYTDSSYPNESLYILNGVLTSSFGFAEHSGYLHIETTYKRFGSGLKLRAVQAALVTAAQGQFTNRDVYAVGLTDIGGEIGDSMVGFW